MKIKVDKEEYEYLVERVKRLEEAVDGRTGQIFDNWTWTREMLYKMMEDYFKHSAEVILVHRDKEKIIGELKGVAMDNIFKEEAKGENNG